ncbi:MAG TPA: substrate-binding domain-containing protein [Verrucomicrobiae bacterium]|nr:substrate-binding domain-containing protein [Verrucomicrobiae bacterium]
MRQRIPVILFGAVLVAMNSCAPAAPPQKPVVRVAVIGGMMMTGMWQGIARQFEADTGYTTRITMAGNKQLLVESFHKGKADFVTLHASDEAANLVADGYAVGMRPWTKNELIIVGPVDDPAHIRGMSDGAAALRRIADTQSAYVDFNDSGARQIADKLWKKAGIMPKGDWVIKDESEHPQIVTFAQKHHAYVIVGRIPVVKHKIDSDGMEVMVRGDPDMLRPFVVMIANVNRFPHANVRGAQELADYLTSERAQEFLKDFAAKEPDGVPLFYPIAAILPAGSS